MFTTKHSTITRMAGIYGSIVALVTTALAGTYQNALAGPIPQAGETITLEWGTGDPTYNWDPRQPIPNPVSTIWHEIYPNFSQNWHLASWNDNGDGVLSPSDKIDMDFGGIGGIPNVEFHVDDLTITLWLTEKDQTGQPTGLQSAIELNVDELGYPRINSTMVNPIGTLWHEVYPDFSQIWYLASWEDNGDDMLSPSDQIDMDFGGEGGTKMYFHIDRVTTDLVLTAPEPGTLASLSIGFLVLFGYGWLGRKPV